MNLRMESNLKKKKEEVTIRSSIAEYLLMLPMSVTRRTVLKCTMRMRIYGSHRR